MKGVLDLLRRATPAPAGGGSGPAGGEDSRLFTTAFADQGIDEAMLVPWEARANEVGARRLPADRGTELLTELWAKDKFMSRLDAAAVRRLEKYFDFATVQAGRDVIRQDEYGNFLVVVLTGTLGIDRVQAWGEQMRLAQARPGDILGEMSLLDSGKRFSLCTTLSECELAVLSTQGMDEMMNEQPQLAAALVALLARKLSNRLRAVGARLSDERNERRDEEDGSHGTRPGQ